MALGKLRCGELEVDGNVTLLDLKELSTYNLEVRNKGALPIGATYLQLPGKDDPSVLFTGTWTDISSTYAGRFFRVAGGDGGAFGDTQEDQMQRIYGYFNKHGNNDVNLFSSSGAQTTYGAFNPRSGGTESWPSASSSAWSGYNLTFDSLSSPNSRASSSTAGETRPVSRTIKVWERTS